MGLSTLERLIHHDSFNGLIAHTERDRVPVDSKDLTGIAAKAFTTKESTRVYRRRLKIALLISSSLQIRRICALALKHIVQAFVRARIVVLEIHHLHLRSLASLDPGDP